MTRAQATANREALLRAASRLFRERGFDGIGIAELAAATGLTHGGFYGHFESKAALAAEALGVAFEATRTRLDGLAAPAGDGTAGDGTAPADPISRLLDRYLSVGFRDAWGDGCPVAALAVDTARTPADSAVRTTFAAGLRGVLGALGRLLPAAWARRRRHEQSLLLLSSLVGALIMARALGDDPLSEEFLAVVRREARRALDTSDRPRRTRSRAAPRKADADSRAAA